jgi:Domain of unknown function (DUF4440)
MKKLALLVTLFAFVPSGFAAEQATDSTKDTKDPMAGWVPRKVTRDQQDKKEIAALCKTMHAAAKSGDLNAAVALVDFPVLMVTDDSKGEATAESWTREKWMEVMAPFYKPMPGVKMTEKPTIFLLTDSLASLDNQWTMTAGNKTTTGRSSMILIRKDGQWRVKSMVEGGWGDMMKEKPAAASLPSEPSGTGSSSGTGSTSGADSASGTGSASPTPAPPSTGTNPANPAEPQGTTSPPTK